MSTRVANSTSLKEQERYWNALVKRKRPTFAVDRSLLPTGLTLPPDGDLGPRPGELSKAGVHYILEGPSDGPLVLCIHGITDFSFRFTLMAAALVKAGHRVLRLDMPGRGWSVAPKDFAFDAASHVGTVCGLLDELQLTPSVLVAHSMGCIVANLLVAELPSVTAAVLLAPAGKMAPPVPGYGVIKWLANTCFGKRLLLPTMAPFPPKPAPPPPFCGDWVMQGEEAGGLGEALQCWDLQWMTASNHQHGKRPFLFSAMRMPMTTLARHLPKAPAAAGGRAPRMLVLTAEHDGSVKNVDTAFYQRVYGEGSVEVEPPWPATGHCFYIQDAEGVHARVLRFLGAGAGTK